MKINIKPICKSSRLYKNNTAPVFIRLTQGRKVSMISTGVAVNPAHWDMEQNCIGDECPQRGELQQKVDAKMEWVNRQIAKLELLELDVTLDVITGNKFYCG